MTILLDLQYENYQSNAILAWDMVHACTSGIYEGMGIRACLEHGTVLTLPFLLVDQDPHHMHWQPTICGF